MPRRTRPGHLTIIGTRVPASKLLYLPPRNGPARPMRPELGHRVILVPIVDHRAVVARDDHEGVAGELQAVERGQDFADAPVELGDGVAAGAHGRRADEARFGTRGTCGSCGAK